MFKYVMGCEFHDQVASYTCFLTPSRLWTPKNELSLLFLWFLFLFNKQEKLPLSFFVHFFLGILVLLFLKLIIQVNLDHKQVIEMMEYLELAAMSSYKDSLKVLEADIQHANVLWVFSLSVSIFLFLFWDIGFLCCLYSFSCLRFCCCWNSRSFWPVCCVSLVNCHLFSCNVIIMLWRTRKIPWLHVLFKAFSYKTLIWAIMVCWQSTLSSCWWIEVIACNNNNKKNLAHQKWRNCFCYSYFAFWRASLRSRKYGVSAVFCVL